jgi:hypothetical protein
VNLVGSLRLELDSPLRLAPCAGEPELFLRILEEPLGEPGPLTLQRHGSELHVSGDGLRGVLGERRGELHASGGPQATLAALRLAVATWLLPRGGLLLHGACVEWRGAAHVFLGESGAGKTTLVSSLEKARVIHDEVTCVRAGRVFGHPFASRAGDGVTPPEGLPLASVSFLRHAPHTTREALSGAERTRRLLKRVFLPLKDAQSLQLALQSVAALDVPAFELGVRLGDAEAALP